MNQVHLQDFLTADIAPESYDLVIADPPYNIGKDFGNKSDRQPMDDYMDWSLQWYNKALECLNPDGLMYVYGNPEILARFSSQLEYGTYRMLVWHSMNRMVIPNYKFYQRCFDLIICAWKSPKPPPLQVDQIREKYRYYDKMTSGRGTCKSGLGVTAPANKLGAMPRDVTELSSLSGALGAKEIYFMCLDCDRRLCAPGERAEHHKHNVVRHPTQKPKAITTRLIKSVVPMDDPTGYKVLIPFSGSGAESVVAQELGVDSDAYDINPDYVELARKWLGASWLL